MPRVFSYQMNEGVGLSDSPVHDRTYPTDDAACPAELLLNPAEHNFDPSEDAAVLNSAMNGVICALDKRTIMNKLCSRNASQLSRVSQSYKSLYNKDLISDLRSSLKPNFSTVAQALVTDRYDFYAHHLHAALLEPKVDGRTVIEILVSLSSSEIRKICSSYCRIFKKTLEQDLNGYTSGTFKKLCISLAENFRDEDSYTNDYIVRFDALMLCDTDPRVWAKSDSILNGILVGRSYEHLRLVFDEYKKLSGKDIEDVILQLDEEFAVGIDGQQEIVKRAKGKINYLADRLLSGFYKSRKSFGTNDRTLIRLIVGRSGIDLGDIKEAFKLKCGESLEKWIEDDTFGDFRNALLAVVGTASPRTRISHT